MDKNLLTPEKVDIKEALRQNVVVLIFVFLTLGGVLLSDLPFYFMVTELVSRISQNSFLVLSLIIPIMAGVGLNFGIVVGAMAGQMALIFITYQGWDGTGGLLLAVLLSTPLAILFGYLTGVLFNKTKGQEMIAGLIVGFFANGLYQFVFLFLLGAVIPLKDTPMLKPDGIGLRNTISMGSKHGEGIKYAFDYIFRVNIWWLVIGAVIVLLIILMAAPMASAVPMAVLAAILIMVASKLGAYVRTIRACPPTC